MRRIPPEGVSLARLAEVLGGDLSAPEHAQVKIRAAVAVSRHTVRDSIFVALRGQKADGHAFLAEAFECGSVAALVDDSAVLRGRPGLVVKDTRAALSHIAALFAGYAARNLRMIGITGTNGKTTTNWLMYHLLNRLGEPCIRIGTLGVRSELGLSRPGNLTTPDPLGLHGDLRQALDSGVKSCVIEASSHALDQRRVDDLEFDVALFTNLTRDHLDYHKEMEAYFAAKLRLFGLLSSSSKPTKAAVINVETDYGRRLWKECRELGLKDYSFSFSHPSTFRICSFQNGLAQSLMTIQYQGQQFTIKSHFMGRHNAENLTGALAGAVALGYEPALVAKLMEDLPQVPGRLEVVGEAKFHVFVDYAHTPDALERALGCLRELTPGSLWVIFGCGGDRDRGKRAQMADVAVSLADRVVVTSDNPRTEDPQAIISEILSGPAGNSVRANGIIEADRRIAIENTLLQALPGDVILIAGKGHEDYQVLGTRKVYFSDQKEVERVLRSLGKV
jgi:UDP-N-acetylmuramoyl-L-alanyl-D-glutamate--2,6-diaminopimelate ligase